MNIPSPAQYCEAGGGGVGRFSTQPLAESLSPLRTCLPAGGLSASGDPSSSAI